MIPNGLREVTMRKIIHLAGGCFWGVEKFFSLLPGVIATETGYANGTTENPTYRQVCRENTGHAETVAVEYDPGIISLPFLLDCYYQAIDPLSVNRQGDDIGAQYRTGVYFSDLGDEPVIRASIRNLERSLGQPVAIEVAPLARFDPAEEYHQKYLDKNPGGYCHIRPELFEWAKTVKNDKEKDK